MWTEWRTSSFQLNSYGLWKVSNNHYKTYIKEKNTRGTTYTAGETMGSGSFLKPGSSLQPNKPPQTQTIVILVHMLKNVMNKVFKSIFSQEIIIFLLPNP